MSDFELSADEFRALYDRVKYMSRWGPADRRGALNNVSPAPVESQVAPDNPDPVVHQMTHPRTSPAAASGLPFVMNRVAMNIHGNTGSHIDAHCHIIFDGILYNGIGADAVTAAGATELDDLVAVREELNRWSFLCVVTPLRLRAATGSPVNPIAIF